MKRLKNLALMVVLFIFVSTFSACDVYTYTAAGTQTRYENPDWAPTYYEGVRYYYLPDIEAYYDLSAREFVYLSNGQWYYSPNYPTSYVDFDLNTSFTIALDVNIYKPWMHHQYYVSHYPRYYYRDYYDHSNIPYVRGFNENSKSAIYWPEQQRNRARSWDGEGLRSNKQFRYTTADRQKQNSMRNSTYNQSGNNANRQQQSDWNNNSNNSKSSGNDNTNRNSQNSENNNKSTSRNSSNNNANSRQQNSRNSTSVQQSSGNNGRQTTGNTSATSPRATSNDNVTRQPTSTSGSVRTTQSTNYYGRTIGQPVKVERQMRQSVTRTADKNTNTTDNKSDQSNQGRR